MRTFPPRAVPQQEHPCRLGEGAVAAGEVVWDREAGAGGTPKHAVPHSVHRQHRTRDHTPSSAPLKSHSWVVSGGVPERLEQAQRQAGSGRAPPDPSLLPLRPRALAQPQGKSRLRLTSRPTRGSSSLSQTKRSDRSEGSWRQDWPFRSSTNLELRDQATNLHFEVHL